MLIITKNKDIAWNEGIKGEKTLKIIKTDKNPLCIIAGPGTGKTFALMRRTARLLQEESITPSKILVVTFTRATAQDLVEELSKLNVKGTDKIRATTLHSFCFSTLMKRGVLNITDRYPRTLLNFEKRFLLEDLKELGLGKINDLKKDIKAFEAAWARLQHEEPGWPENSKDKILSRELEGWLLYHKAMLLEELIPLTLNYLKNNPACTERKMFQHIFVDEYQDLNKAEQTLVELLASNASIMVIGDEDQSIYESFRYAHPEGIINYGDDHPENRFFIEECRRCPTKVVELANTLINYNKLRKEKILEPVEDNIAGEVQVVQWENMEDETIGISKFVKEKINNGIDPGRILVLCPYRQLGYNIRDELNDNNINAHSFFNEELLEGSPIDDEKSIEEQIFTILTLLAYPEDMVALRCFLGFGSSTLLAKSYKRLINHCKENNITPKEALEKMIDDGIIIPYTKPLMERYKKLKKILAKLNGLNGVDLVNTLFPKEDWAEPFRTLLIDIDDDETPIDIYNMLKNNITQPEMPSDVDYVRVMSLYKSKGLTADLVVICGCIDGFIPYRTIEDSIEESQRYIEEQRRLFYVGITRTTNILLISSFLKLPAPLVYKMGIKYKRFLRGKAETISSPFIHELGPKLPNSILGEELFR